MSTPVEPIATPRAGAAKRSAKSTAVRADGIVARFSTGKKSRRYNAGSLLRALTGAASGDHQVMLTNIRKGLPFKVIESLEKAYDSPRKEIAEALCIPVSTLTRRKKEGRLHADESDRVARFARLMDAAVAMMQGDHEAAVQWLHTPQDVLGNESPMVHASTELGARDVEDLIGRIRHGVFS